MHLSTRIRVYEVSADKFFVCSAITGELFVINGEMRRQLDALSRGEMGGCSPETLRLLESKRLLFRSKAEEDELFRGVVEQAALDYQRRARNEYCFAVNSHCNFACTYCFEPESARDRISTLSEEQLDSAFQFVDANEAKLSLRRAPEFALYGGEPLLVPSKAAVVSVIRRVASRGFGLYILTNGYNLQHFFDVFDAYHEHVTALQIPLDGMAIHHDKRRLLRGGAATHTTIVANIDAFLARPYQTLCNLRITFDQASISSIGELNEWLEARGWAKHPRVQITPATIQDHTPGPPQPGLISQGELLEAAFPYSPDCDGGPFDLANISVLGHVRNALAQAAQGHPREPFAPRVNYCGAVGARLFVFYPDGRVYPCYEATGDPKLALGAYHPELRHEEASARAWWNDRILRVPECFECNISTFCGGGCARGAIGKHGTCDRPFCEGAQGALDAYFAMIANVHRQRSQVQ